MKIINLFKECLGLGVLLLVEDDNLVIEFLEVEIAPGLRELIQDNRNGLVNLIQSFYLITGPNQGQSDSFPELLKVLPLSFNQRSIWSIEKNNCGSSNFNMSRVIRLSGTLDVEVLNNSICTIIERHESLRTCFAVGEDGEAYQVVQATPDIKLVAQNLSMLEVEEKEQTAARIINEEASKSFDLSADLLLRGRLLKLATEEHLLLLTTHHISSDDLSMSILFTEISTLYSAYSKGRENPLPPLAIQYADYAHRQRSWLQGEAMDKQMEYWEDQLSGLPIVHSLPLDYPRPVEQRYAVAVHVSQVGTQTRESLRALCRDQGATLFMGLQATFSLLLSRYSNETDIVMGSPIVNRNRAEVADLIGCFMNTLVLRNDLSAELSFLGLLSQSKTMLLEAYAHQQVPFEQILERLRPELSLSHSPLFQVMLVVQRNEQRTLELPGLRLSPVERGGYASNYDLTLIVNDGPAGLQLMWEYNTDLFASQTIERMSAHFGLLLDAALKAPEENVFKLSMLSESERHRLLVDWNDTTAEYEKSKCIHELFEDQVAHEPDAVALIFGDQELTYGELNARSNQLAHYLTEECGVVPDTLVGICVERSLEMVVGILGILKAGGAYVPLDPGYPEARLSYMLKDSGINLLLSQSYVALLLPLGGQSVLCLDVDGDSHGNTSVLSSKSTENLPKKNSGLNSEHLAYVIYTSGSTGQPKGVMVEHRALSNFLHWKYSCFPCGPQEIYLQKTATSFDISVSEIMVALTSGSRLVIAAPGWETDIPYFLELINGRKVTTLSLVPTLLRELLGVSEKLGSVKNILCGGEAMPRDLVDMVNQHLPGCVLHNLYGPTEATIAVSSMNCRLLPESQYVPIGAPIANTQFYVVDERLRMVPLGVSGELLIGGESLSRGYLNQGDLTLEKFIANPFEEESHSRLYRTGDLVRWLPDGNLEYLGRIDQQVKIRGFRIELGEIEHSLGSHGGVQDTVVLARESEDGDKRLVAYVVTDSIAISAESKAAENQKEFLRQQQEFIESLRRYLGARIPEYMVPSAYVLLEQLPLTPNGKVDHKALPEPDTAISSVQYVRSQTELEKTLCEIWQEVLSIEKVGVEDNFFKLGGHSLLTVRLINRIKSIGYEVTLSNLFSYPTVASLAKSIQNQSRTMTRVAGATQPSGQVNKELFGLDGDRSKPAHFIARLLNRIQSIIYGIQISDLVKYATVPSLANSIKKESKVGNVKEDPLLMKGGGSGLPLFVVHEVTGDVIPYIKLIELLNSDIPVYGLNAPWVHASMDVEEIAANHVNAIRNIQSIGPYYMIGWSAGAVIAYEIAQQLNEVGESIQFLGLIDPLILSEPSKNKIAPIDHKTILIEYIRSASGIIDDELIEKLEAFSDSSKAFRYCQDTGILLSGIGIEEHEQRFNRRIWITQAVKNYHPRRLPIRVDAFLASDSLPDDISRDWRSLLGSNIQEHKLGGEHKTMLREPDVKRLSVQVNKVLSTLGEVGS